jgi:WD40 repeat protein
VRCGRSIGKGLVILLSLSHLGAAQVPEGPQLRVETGSHTAAIETIGVDGAGKYLVTGSLDKTVRIWDLADGALLGVIRPPIGPGHQGQLHAVALSREGELVAADGSTGSGPAQEYAIYLFARATGRMLKRIGGLPGTVRQLTFSRDGKRLAAAISSGGVRLYSVQDGQELGRAMKCDADDRVSTSSGAGFDFDREGRLAASCNGGGDLRIFDAELKPVLSTAAPEWAHLESPRFSPDGQRIAAATRYGKVFVFSARDLHLLYAINTEDSASHFAWSPDGDDLCVLGIGRAYMTCWRNGGLASRRLSIPDLVPAAIAAVPQGFVVCDYSSAIWRISMKDPPSRITGPLIGDIYMNRDEHAVVVNFFGSLRTSNSGEVVQFGYLYFGDRSAVFSVRDRELGEAPHQGDRLEPARTKTPGLDLQHLPDNWLWSAYAIAPDERSFVVGTDEKLMLLDRKRKTLWEITTPSHTAAVNISGDGRVVLAAFSDGTIRWYRVKDGQELLTLFLHIDHKRWVLWTPSGYYAAAVGAEELVGWHVNQGPEQASDFFPISRFRDRFYRPDIVARILSTLDEATALAQADSAAHRKGDAPLLTRLLPPLVTILSPANEAKVRSTDVRFKIAVRSPSGDPVTAVRAYVNGRPAVTTRGLTLDVSRLAAPQSAETYTLTVPIPQHDCTVAIAAETGLSSGEPAAVKLLWAAPATLPERKPKLYVLAVGVGAYANPDYRLDLPAKDARDVAAAWKAQEGGLYREVEIRLLTDEKAKRDSILGGLEWLQDRTEQRDVAVLFFAGHGLNDPVSQEYAYLPHDADLSHRLRTLIPNRDFRAALAAIRGKVLVFLDTCHAGNLLGGASLRDLHDLTRTINELTSAESGIVVFAASSGRGTAQESAELKNGAFSRALIEALSGKAKGDADGALRITAIERYLAERVPELTHEQQSRYRASPTRSRTFPWL